jgi:uncharacterized protein (TIGR00255 family)
MLISMTGFGRALLESSFGRLVVELQSVNRKFLEVFVSLPKELGRFEMELRKWISEETSRGQVSVRVFLTLSEQALSQALPPSGLLKRLRQAWKELAQECGTDPAEVNLAFLLGRLPPSTTELASSDEEILRELKTCFMQALAHALSMKRKEGAALEQDILGRLSALEKIAHAIEQLSPQTVEKMREKLKERIQAALEPSAALDERLLREVAFFAERVDISEEIARLHSHFAQFRQSIQGKESGVGRKLEFLVQEIGREINTIGSKALDAAISKFVVEGKAELEKVREQIQNIE